MDAWDANALAKRRPWHTLHQLMVCLELTFRKRAIVSLCGLVWNRYLLAGRR